MHVYEYVSPQSTDNHLTTNSILEDFYERRRRTRRFGSDDVQDTTREKQLLSDTNEDLSEQVEHQGRGKRQTNGQPPRRRYNGQTQTQYVAFNKDGNGEKSGTAEAVAQPDLSRATVSK